jgi:phosphoglycerate dehydrogenase-like enzyme
MTMMMNSTTKEAIAIVSFSTHNPDRQAELRAGVAALLGARPFELTFPLDEAAALASLTRAEIMLTWKFTPELHAAARQLRWLHLTGAGTEHVLTPELRASEIVVTNSRGIHGAYMAEWTLAALLYLGQRFAIVEQWRRDRNWKPHKDHVQRTRFLLRGRRALVLGYGEVGRAIAKLLSSVGVECEAVATHARAAELPVHPLTSLPELLPHFDIVVVALPLTEHTRGLVNRAFFARMKRDSIFVNVARGRIVNEVDLVTALTTGPLAFAALDVFATEPLPPASPLFALPNAFLAPHVSGNFPSYTRDVNELFLENLRAYLAGEPLRFVVNKQRGY